MSLILLPGLHSKMRRLNRHRWGLFSIKRTYSDLDIVIPLLSLIGRRDRQSEMAGRKGRSGAPKLTPELQTKIVAAIRQGNYREVAAQWAGIAPETFCRWMKRPERIYADFRQAVLEAEKAAEIQAVARIMRAAAEDPKYAQWWLERKFPQRWARRSEPDYTRLSDQELLEIVSAGFEF